MTLGRPSPGGAPQALELHPPLTPHHPSPRALLAQRPAAQASQPRDGSRDRKCPPAQTAPPFPAAPSPPNPGRAAGPGSPGSRGRRSRQRRPVGGRGPRPLLRSPQLSALRDQGAHKRKGRAARNAPASPLDPLRGDPAKHPRTPKLRTPRREPPTQENSKALPPHHHWELQGRPNHPAAGAPGRTTLKLWGRARGRGGGAPKRRK